MTDLPQPTVRDLAVMASPAYERAKQAAADFTAGMNRLVAQAGESPESVERLRAAVLRMAEGDVSEAGPGAPYVHDFTPRPCGPCTSAGDPECRDGLLYRDGGPELDYADVYVGRCAHACHQPKPSYTVEAQ